MEANELYKKASGYAKQLLYGLHPLTKDIDRRVNKRWVVHKCIVSNNWYYCYFRIPKSANSTIARSLAYYDPTIVYRPAEDIMGRGVKKNFSNLLSSRALTVDALMKRYYLFTFVRNPYTRILSAYLDKISRLENEAFEKNRDYVKTFSDSQRDLTFKAFIRYLEKDGLYKNPHWIPQTAMLPVSVNKVHFVGKVENLSGDLECVINHIYGEGVFKEPLTREHGRTDSVGRLVKYYDSDLSKRVYTLYKDDFDAFAYAKDLPISDASQIVI